MIFRITAALLGATLFLSACDGDSRPFTEAVEVRTLNLESVEVLSPTTTLADIFLNINQGLQLGVRGVSGVGNPIALSATDRAWSVSDPSIASVTDNGYLRALANGPVEVSVSIGGVDSVGFGVTVSQATLSEISSISGLTTLERCIPQTYFATGTFSDNTSRNLDDLTWAVNNPANASLFDSSGTSTSLNALAAMDQLTLTATAPSGQSLDQSLIVSDSLQAIAIRQLPIILDVGAELNVTAIGVYSDNTGEAIATTREVNITDDVDWAVVTGIANLSVSNVRGTKGLLTGLDEDNDANITATCGLDDDRVPVDINAAGTSTATTLAFKIGNELVTNNQITLSLAANPGSIPILASTGSEYNEDDDVTVEVDFRIGSSISGSTPFEINGNDTSTPTIQLTGTTGTATIVATETNDGDAVETITITVINQ